MADRHTDRQPDRTDLNSTEPHPAPAGEGEKRKKGPGQMITDSVSCGTMCLLEVKLSITGDHVNLKQERPDRSFWRVVFLLPRCTSTFLLFRGVR